jgi:hypothetical protein|tara:strand:- start:3335 stop:5089 length:1755 start_codon:yes stop_codon:yes gene_type:complete
MAPRTNIYQEYEDILSNRGLGSVPANNKSRLQLGIESGRLRDPSSIPERPGTGIDELQRGLINLGNILKSGGLSQAYQPPKNIGEATQQIKTSGDVDTTDSSLNIFQVPGEVQDASVDVLSPDKPSDSVLAQSMAGKTGVGYKGRGEMVEKPGERADALAQAEMAEVAETAGETALVQGIGEDIKKKGGVDAFANTFQQAMEQFGANVRGTSQPSQSKTLDDYKKEFAEATGIDISGKVDKSHALMSLGLALMQNRAGKGFNVGRILNAVGEAGQAALPALMSAKQEAKQAQLLAGQYALQERKNDMANQRAAAQADKDFQRDLYLKWYDNQLDRQLENDKNEFALEKMKLEAAATGADPKKFNKKHEFTFATGQGDASSWKIPVVYDENSPSGGIILKPTAMAKRYIDGREGVGDALDLIRDMREAAREIAEGGGTAKFAFDKLNSIAKALFPDLNTGEASAAQKYNQGVNMIMGRFKRFLTQETGNGISNRDVEIWEKEIMKKPDWFTNFDETNAALNNLEDIFMSKLGEYDAGLDFLFDPQNLRPEDFERLNKEFGDVEDIKSGGGLLVFQDGKLVRRDAG